jgi:hypothetical protein
MRPFRQSGSHHFQMPTAGPPISHPEQGTLERATYSPVRFDAGPRGPPRPLSLSSAYKSDGRWKISPPPLHCFFLPAEVSTTTTHRQLAAVLPGHSTIPLVELLLTLSCFFCPTFHDHRAGAPTSIVHPAGNLRRR